MQKLESYQQLAAAMTPVVLLTAVFNAILVAALYVPIKKALGN